MSKMYNETKSELNFLRELMLSIKNESGKKLFIKQVYKSKETITLNNYFPNPHEFFLTDLSEDVCILRERFHSIDMTIACIKEGYTEIPKCPICGNPRSLSRQGRHLLGTCGDKKCAFSYMVLKNKENHGGVFSTADPICREKSKKTCIEKYGTEYPSQNTLIKEKTAATNLNKYGTSVPVNSPELHDIMVENCIRKYGVKSYSQTEEFKEKYKNTCLARYGVKHAFMAPNIKNKIREKMIKTYGVNSFAKTECFKKFMTELHSKKRDEGYIPTPRSKYKYNNIYFDSSWELAYYMFNQDLGIDIKRNTSIFKYYVDCKEYGYIPDFIVNNRLVEIKGDYLWDFNNKSDSKKIFFKGERLKKEIAKKECAENNNVKILYKEDIKDILQYCIDKFNNKYWYRKFKID